MLRFLRRKFFFCILLIALFLTFKKHIPEIGNKIGNWIAGTADKRVASTVSNMLDSFSSSTKEAVEVFCDGLRNFETD